jgi:hypothetical protein
MYTKSIIRMKKQANTCFHMYYIFDLLTLDISGGIKNCMLTKICYGTSTDTIGTS